MPTDQYHEPPAELSDDSRTFARVIASLQEEAEAIGWYEQRMSIETNEEARRIMEHAQREEFLHFSMDLEFLARRKEKWRVALQKILFRDGDIIELAEQAEDEGGLVTEQRPREGERPRVRGRSRRASLFASQSCTKPAPNPHLIAKPRS
jgi:hypothetical protein